MSEQPTYRKLPGSGSPHRGFLPHFGVRTQLYMADDHLLLIKSGGISERYVRLFFRDIQAMYFQETRLGTFWTIFLAILSLTLLGFFLTFPNPALMVFLVPFLLVTIYNIVLGGTCHTSLHTKVQIVPLTALNRVKGARRSLTIIRDQVERLQGSISPESFEENAVVQPSVRRSKSIANVYSGNWHAWMFALWSVLALFTGLYLWTGVMVLNVVSVFILLGIGVLSLAILAKMRKQELTPFLQGMTIASTSLWFVYGLTLYLFFSLAAGIKFASGGQNLLGFYQAFLDPEIFEAPGLIFGYQVSLGFSVALAVLGFCALAQYRNRRGELV